MMAPKKQELLRFHLDEFIRALQASDPVFEGIDVVVVIQTPKDHKLNTLGNIPPDGIRYYLTAGLQQASTEEAHQFEDVPNQ